MSYTYERLQDKTFGELKRIAQQLNVLPAGDRRFRQNWTDTIAGVNPPLLELLEVELVVEPIESEPKFDCGAAYPLAARSIAPAAEISSAPPESDDKGYRSYMVDFDLLSEIDEHPETYCQLHGVERVDGDDFFNVGRAQEPIWNFPTVTFSPRFLARYSLPQFEQIFYKADADGQLNLLDFEVESADEPPDPDDYLTEFEFRVAYDVWCDRNSDIDACEFSEPLVQFLDSIEPELTSMSHWAPCPDEWYEPVIAGDDVNRCPCGAMPASQCDGTTVTHIYPDRIVFTPCYRNNLDDIEAELVLCDRVGGRSPPGGDVMA